MKSTYFTQLYINMFCIQDHTKNFNILWAMPRNGWKCIVSRVSWFVCVLLNFNVLYNSNTVQKHYTGLLRSNWILCLVLRIIFWNHFLTVSNEVEDHLWLYFVYFLNHNLFMEKFIVKFLHRGTPIS